ncbi:TPA: hypothetical protein OOF39_004593 [Kluyvera ascorbata]|nr:hypothetical protein [Kluyvera ascorbata]
MGNFLLVPVLCPAMTGRDPGQHCIEDAGRVDHDHQCGCEAQAVTCKGEQRRICDGGQHVQHCELYAKDPSEQLGGGASEAASAVDCRVKGGAVHGDFSVRLLACRHVVSGWKSGIAPSGP